ncbi:MAG TPA: DUF222 domain-containing protein, partial [Actinomycetota bacterium]
GSMSAMPAVLERSSAPDAVGGVGRALEGVREVELRRLSDAEVEHGLGALRRAAGMLDAETARWLREAERRGAHEREGHSSMASWVEHRFATTWGDAARQVRMARALEEMPATREALYSGEVSTTAVGQLVEAREANPKEFSRVESVLVDAARTLPVRDLRKAVTHWRDAVDAEAVAREERDRFERRGLNISPTLDRMVRLDGNLDPETGQTVLTAVQAVIDADARRGPTDRRTPAQRRADALGVVCRQWLARSDRPVVGGERPHITVVVDLEALEGRTGYRCELSDTGAITPEAARRWACDAKVSRVITRGRSEPIEIGRASKVVPAGIRRALVVRDGGCAFPGCHRPPSWTVPHHIRHWTDGGETNLSNLALFCWEHHDRFHHDGFSVRIVDGKPVVTRPDGTVMENRAPP